MGLALRGGSGLKHQGFAVLTGTTAPAVLLEHGFHTNQTDTRNLKDSTFRAKLAEANVRGILDYLGIKWQSDTPTTEPKPITPTAPAENKEDEIMPVIYAKLNDVPESYRPTIRKLMEDEALVGYDNPDPNRLDDNLINVTEDYCRVMTTLNRKGLLDIKEGVLLHGE